MSCFVHPIKEFFQHALCDNDANRRRIKSCFLIITALLLLIVSGCATVSNELAAPDASIPSTKKTDSLIDIQTLNRQTIDNSIAHLSNRGRNNFKLALSRSAIYRMKVRAILTEKGLPQCLEWLPLVESAYNPYAKSPAGAAGLWQFMEGTGRNYGLRIDLYIDERRDPEKSTKAAARYLKDLHMMFGDWKLALMGYNWGERRVLSKIVKCNTQRIDILELPGDEIPLETRLYLHHFTAALMIVSHPEVYGFSMPAPELEPLYKIVRINRGKIKGKPVDLAVFAKKHSVRTKTIKALNPAILKNRLPGYEYEIRLPA